MLRVWGIVGVCLLTAGPGLAQEPALRFQWTAGQTLTYQIQQATTVSETTLEDGTNKMVTGVTVTKLNLTRTWAVKSVDPTGTATLEMTITAFRQQIVRPGPLDKDGKPTLDRTVIDSSTPEGQQQTAAFLNKSLVTVKIDTQGRLIDAKTASGSAERLQADLPFRLVFPDQSRASWDRTFTVKLDPPQGTGEKYDATQTFTTKPDTQGLKTFGMTTALKAPPTDAAEWPPLVPLLWEGDLFVHAQTGRYVGARLHVKRDVANHQGEGTKFAYESTYTEDLVQK